MKWNRKKSSSLIDRVFPVSWFSKFKHKRGDHESDPAQLTNNNLLHLPSPTAPRYRGGRFYSLDEDDAFWRISFGEDRVPPRRSCGGVNHDIGNSNFRNLRLGEGEVSRKGEFRNFSEMVSDVKKMREKERVKHVRESIHILPMETKMKSESHLKKRRENSKGCNCNFKAYSPRTELKIRALEEKKRSRARKERVDSVFDDSFAVVKSSLDPERDFKESMVEMIREKGICNPYDLEQLLACYLTLNSDEYHDLIITVFRQVWIEQKN